MQAHFVRVRNDRTCRGVEREHHLDRVLVVRVVASPDSDREEAQRPIERDRGRVRATDLEEQVLGVHGARMRDEGLHQEARDPSPAAVLARRHVEDVELVDHVPRDDERDGHAVVLLATDSLATDSLATQRRAHGRWSSARSCSSLMCVGPSIETTAGTSASLIVSIRTGISDDLETSRDWTRGPESRSTRQRP